MVEAHRPAVEAEPEAVSKPAAVATGVAAAGKTAARRVEEQRAPAWPPAR